MKHEEYEKPVLVYQPKHDTMTPAYYTRKTFAKIKSENKRYIAFGGAHFTTGKGTYPQWANEEHAFIQQL